MKHRDMPAPAAAKAPAAGRQTWRHLYALPLDMRKREARIRQLEALCRQALAQEARAAGPDASENPATAAENRPGPAEKPAPGSAAPGDSALSGGTAPAGPALAACAAAEGLGKNALARHISAHSAAGAGSAQPGPNAAAPVPAAALPLLSARLACQRAALEQAQRDCWQQYQQAAAAIERCPDPLLRAVLHGRCLEGKSYPALAGELARAGIPATADALRKAVDRWLADPAGPESENMDNL